MWEKITFPLIIVAAIVTIWLAFRKSPITQIINTGSAGIDPGTVAGQGDPSTAKLQQYLAEVPDYALIDGRVPYLTYNTNGGKNIYKNMEGQEPSTDCGCGCSGSGNCDQGLKTEDNINTVQTPVGTTTYPPPSAYQTNSYATWAAYEELPQSA